MAAVEQRFRALKAGETVKLHGRLTDTTSFQPLHGLVGTGRTIDLEDLTSASWLGLTGFYRYLIDAGVSGIEIVKVPLAVYQNLRLIGTFRETVKIGSFEVETFDLLAPATRPTCQLVRPADLASAAAAQGDFVTLGSRAVAAPVAHLCPETFGTFGTRPETYKCAWYAANHEQVTFWFSYGAFLATTLSLASGLLETMEAGICDLLGHIQIRVANAEKGMALLTPDLVQGSALQIQALCKRVPQDCTGVLQAIAATRGNIECRNRAMQAAGMGAPGDRMFAELQRLTADVGTLHHVGAQIETAGTTIGGSVLGLKVGQLRQALVNIKNEAVTPALLSEVRDAFALLDFTTEDSWLATKAEIAGELAQIDADIGGCVVLLQGFDLTRQVIEHRLAETATLQAALPGLAAGETAWEGLRDALMALVAKTMVTDQEKQACAFFLSAYQTEDKSEALGGGDLMFF